MFAGLRWSSELDGCPAGDMYIIPSNKAQWHAVGARLGLMMMWVNRSYSEGELTLAARDRKAPLDIDFNMCSDAARPGAARARHAPDVPAAGRYRGAGRRRAGVSDQLQRLGAAARRCTRRSTPCRPGPARR